MKYYLNSRDAVHTTSNKIKFNLVQTLWVFAQIVTYHNLYTRFSSRVSAQIAITMFITLCHLVCICFTIKSIHCYNKQQVFLLVESSVDLKQR